MINQNYNQYSNFESNSNKPDKGVVNLIDYLQIINKKIKLLAFIFFISLLVAAIISFLLPPVFETQNLVRIGKIKNNSLESLDNIKTVFASDFILTEVARQLNLPEKNLGTIVNLFILEENGSDFLIIKGRGHTPEKALEAVNVITGILIERHQKLFQTAENTIRVEIETIKQEEQKTKDDIDQLKVNIQRLEEDIKKYEKEIEKRSTINSEGQGRIVESYINLLAQLKDQKENKASLILELEQKLVGLKEALQQKEYEIEYETKPTIVEISAVISSTEIQPTRQRIIIIGGIFGLFIGIFIVFVADYINKYKKNVV